jgi:hypothetical protein
MDFPQIPMPQLMQMNLGGSPQKAVGGGNMDMGMKILQAALKQQPGAQPAVGQVLPGGATNIAPPQQGGLLGMMQGGGGMGLLSKLLGGGMGGAGAMGGAAGGVTGGLGGLY